jgi:hypothetical protein
MAGMEYSPASELCTVLVNPVDALAMLTRALETLPPDVSKILPESVAVIACPLAIGRETQKRASKHTTQTATFTQGLIRFISLTPKDLRKAYGMSWSISERASGTRRNL